MESDFGHYSGVIDLQDDDFVQDYSNYHREVIDLELVEDLNPVVEVKSVINYDSRYKEKPVKLTKHQRRRENTKHTSKYKPTLIDKFYQQILSWNRNNVIIPFVLPELKESFTTPVAYFNYNAQLTYEECRASICQEMEANDRTGGKSCTLELEEINQEQMKCTFLLRFKLKHSTIDVINFRGGCLFELTHAGGANSSSDSSSTPPYLALVFLQPLERGVKGFRVGDQLYMTIQNDQCSVSCDIFSVTLTH
jgi:hypothetical protein